MCHCDSSGEFIVLRKLFKITFTASLNLLIEFYFSVSFSEIRSYSFSNFSTLYCALRKVLFYCKYEINLNVCYFQFSRQSDVSKLPHSWQKQNTMMTGSQGLLYCRVQHRFNETGTELDVCYKFPLPSHSRRFPFTPRTTFSRGSGSMIMQKSMVATGVIYPISSIGTKQPPYRRIMR